MSIQPVLPNLSTPQPSLMQRVLSGIHQLGQGLFPAPTGLMGTPSISGGPGGNPLQQGTDMQPGGLLGQSPESLGGLLTPDDVDSARKHAMLQMGLSMLGNSHSNSYANPVPGLGGAIAQGVQAGQGGYGNMLASILQQRQLAQQTAQAAQLRQQRQQIFTDLPAPTTGDPEHEKQWAMAVIPRLTAIGDDAGVQRVNQFLETMMKQPPRVPGVLFKNDNTGEVRSFDTSAGQSLPPGWSKLPSDSQGSYDFFVGKDGQGAYVKKGDNEAAAKQIAMGRRVLSNENIVIGQEGANARHSDSDVMRLQTGFRSDIKDLSAQATTYDKALYTINRAMNATDPNERKLLFGAVKSQFVQSSDQSKNLRYQLLQYYEHNMDPSVYGTFDQMLDKMANGEVPNRLLAPMMAHIKGLQRQTKAQIEARRQGFLNANAGRLDPSDLPATDTYFPFQNEYNNSNDAIDEYIRTRGGKKKP